jgi:hypothetical protein
MRLLVEIQEEPQKMAKGPKKLSKSITEKWAMFKLKKG